MFASTLAGSIDLESIMRLKSDVSWKDLKDSLSKNLKTLLGEAIFQKSYGLMPWCAFHFPSI